MLRAFDAKSGNVLWKFQTGFQIASGPSVYSVNGIEYVAITVGGTTTSSNGGTVAEPAAGLQPRRQPDAVDRADVLDPEAVERDGGAQGRGAGARGRDVGARAPRGSCRPGR